MPILSKEADYYLSGHATIIRDPWTSKNRVEDVLLDAIDRSKIYEPMEIQGEVENEGKGKF